MAKMSQYTPLDENDKEYFFGEGEGAVVTVGETSASSGTVNRLVKLSDIGGGGGGGGGGWSYTKATGTFGEKEEKWFPGEQFNQTTRELPVENHTYTVASGNVDTGGGYDTQVVAIKLTQSDFPDAYVQFKTSDSNVTALRHIVVYNGSTSLTRMYAAGAITNGAVYDVRATLDGSDIDVSVEKDGWNEIFPGNESTVLVHIFGDTYNILCSSGTVYGGYVE